MRTGQWTEQVVLLSRGGAGPWRPHGNVGWRGVRWKGTSRGPQGEEGGLGLGRALRGLSPGGLNLLSEIGVLGLAGEVGA